MLGTGTELVDALEVDEYESLSMADEKEYFKVDHSQDDLAVDVSGSCGE